MRQRPLKNRAGAKRPRPHTSEKLAPSPSTTRSGQRLWADHAPFRMFVEPQPEGWMAKVYDSDRHLWVFEMPVENPEEGKAVAWQWVRRACELVAERRQPVWRRERAQPGAG